MGPKIEVIPASSARSSGILNGTNSAPTTSTGFLKIKSEPSTALLTAKDTNTNSKNVTITTPSTVAGLLTLASQSPDLALGGQLQTVITPSSTPITTTTAAAASHIPCIIMQDREKDTLSLTAKQQTIIPEMWTVNDVCQFLRINDCGSHCDIFSKKVSFNISDFFFSFITNNINLNAIATYNVNVCLHSLFFGGKGMHCST